jgi:hypothetical protein
VLPEYRPRTIRLEVFLGADGPHLPLGVCLRLIEPWGPVSLLMATQLGSLKTVLCPASIVAPQYFPNSGNQCARAGGQSMGEHHHD